jgi:hypothetical protein
MRKIIGLFIISIMFLGCASSPTLKPNNTEIINILETGKSKNEVFDLSMRWIAKSFTSSKEVIQYTDKDLGIINGKGTLQMRGGLSLEVTVFFSLVIDIKENKTRLSYKPISFSNDTFHIKSTEFSSYLLNKFKDQTDIITKDYLNYITSTNINW